MTEFETADAYFLCGTPRSGSTLLCAMLAATQVAGRPNSFFRTEDIAEWAADWGVPGLADLWVPDFARSYLDAMITEGRGASSVFGLRLMAENLPQAMATLVMCYPGLRDDGARIAAVFGRTRFIHLGRDDKVAQAVSLVLARQSGLWHRAADGSEMERSAPPRVPVYDATAIAGQVAALEAGERRWLAWFSDQGITPLRLRYETLAADPRAALLRVLDRLGLPGQAAEGIRPAVARLADATNRDWIARYRADSHESTRTG